APTAAGEAHRIAGVLDALRLTGAPVTVVGHSLAGLHAEAFARLHPGRTAGLVLVDASVEEHARTPAAPAARTALARALGAALAAAGVPAALGPAARRAAVRLSRARHAPDPAPAALVRRCYATRRVLDGALLENAHYTSVAAELLALRARHPLPPGAPVTVLAAPDSPDGTDRWTSRQRALAETLGGGFTAVPDSGHLVMLDRPGAVAGAVLTPA
ncbi:alpha/beta fold hydrolase, partial [Streptomyces sp. CC77]|uniref:alpha/beta fold hydrolase n=1 Tax=Streptomyces sp. CC77 TaxID=1906739 RepID=UPI0008DCB86B